MKRIFALVFFLTPAFLCAQIGGLRPAMQLDEVRAKYPDLKRDYGSMTSRVSGEGKQLTISGRVTYLIQCDTVIRYEFNSEPVYGASAEFPAADSTEAMKLLSAGRTLLGHYTDLYGNPSETHSMYFRYVVSQAKDAEILYAKWKNANDEIILRVFHPREDENQINAPVRNSKESISAMYTMEILASGKSLRMRSEFGMGMTGEQFKSWQPGLANQVEDHPDCWMRDDTLGGLDAHWRFQFRNEQLIGYFYDSYGGVQYGQTNEIAYTVLLERAQKMKEEAVKQFGAPYKDSTSVSKKYSSPKKAGNYYSRVDYLAQWKPGNDFLMIRLNERGGGKQGEPVFHLEVYFGKRD